MLQHLLSPVGRGNQGEGETIGGPSRHAQCEMGRDDSGRVARIVEPSTPIRQPWEDPMSSEYDRATPKVITSSTPSSSQQAFGVRQMYSQWFSGTRAFR
jgi:hypothetical protein